MVWTTFTTELDPDKPGRSVDIKAINANITAQANGDSGAPPQTTAGIKDLAVTNSKIADDAVTSTKIASGAVSTSELASFAVTLAKINSGAATYSWTILAGNTTVLVDISAVAGFPWTLHFFDTPSLTGLSATLASTDTVSGDPDRVIITIAEAPGSDVSGKIAIDFMAL